MGKLSAEERPVVGQLANQVRADIEAAHRVRGDEQLGVQVDFAAEEHLLDVAAGELFNLMIGGGRCDFEALDDGVGDLAALCAVHHDAGHVLIGFEQHVVDDGHGADETHAKAILGNKGHGNAAADDIAGR